MTDSNISADELARRTTIPASTIKKIRNRYNPNPTLTTLMPLAQFFMITLGQLVGDEALPKDKEKHYQQRNRAVKYLPLISWTEAMTWPQRSRSSFTEILTENNHNTDSFAITVEDDDWKNLPNGTILCVDLAMKPTHRDLIIVHKIGQLVPSLKQIMFDEEQIYLKPVVPGYSVIPLTLEHRIIGVVTEYKKMLKKV